jgi:hypothetical protein
MLVKKIAVLVAVVVVALLLAPSLGNRLGPWTGLTAQTLPCEGSCGEEGGGCQQTCSPMPASCNGGDFVCDALPGCTICICMERDSNNNCKQWVPQMLSPHQRSSN